MDENIYRRDSWMAGVFISHTAADTSYCCALVLPVIQSIPSPFINRSVFFNYDNFGRGSGEEIRTMSAAYATQIERLLAESKTCAVIVSSASIKSEWVAWEVDWWLKTREMESLLAIQRDVTIPGDLDPRLENAETIVLNEVNEQSKHILEAAVRELLCR